MVWIGHVHQHKPSTRVALKQAAQMPWFDSLDRHLALPCIIARMNFEWQIMLNRQFNAARPAPIAQTCPICLTESIAAQMLLQNALGIGIAAFLPQQGAVVGVLSLD